MYKYLSDNDDKVSIKVNGENYPLNINNGYVQIDRDWKKGDVMELHLPMKIRKILASENVKADIGRIAFERGPIVFCAEWVDNDNKVRNLLIDKNVELNYEFQPDLLNGIGVLTGKATALSIAKKDAPVIKTQKPVTLIPYYSWAHRGDGEMIVWIPYDESVASPTTPPTIASNSKVTASHCHYSDKIAAVNDKKNPKNSNDHDVSRLTFWNHKGTDEWVQYDFKKPEKVSSIDIYWFDDGPNGGCRIPESWKLFYKKNEEWKEVVKHGKYPVEKDKFNTIVFSSVTTKGLRLEIK